MSNYIEINEVKIPLTQKMYGCNWELELIHKNFVYYWTNDTMKDTALMCCIENGKLELRCVGVLAHDVLYGETINIVENHEKPLYMSESFQETLKTLI